MGDCPQPCMCPTCYAPYMDEPVTLEDKLAAPDPAAIREAALREAIEAYPRGIGAIVDLIEKGKGDDK